MSERTIASSPSTALCSLLQPHLANPAPPFPVPIPEHRKENYPPSPSSISMIASPFSQPLRPTPPRTTVPMPRPLSSSPRHAPSVRFRIKKMTVIDISRRLPPHLHLLLQPHPSPQTARLRAASARPSRSPSSSGIQKVQSTRAACLAPRCAPQVL